MGNACRCCTSPPSNAGSPPPSPSPHPPIISSPDPSIPTTSSPPPSINSLKPLVQRVNPTDQIDPLINFIEDQLQRVKASPEKASTSSSLLNSVAPNTSLAAKIVDTISTEAGNLYKTDIAKEMGELALSGLKMVGEAHWIFIGLSVAAYALERCVTARSNVSECIDLLEKIGFLAKDLKRFKEAMPGESERLCQAVQIIVEGAIMCCDYISKGKLSRYWKATTVNDHVQKATDSIRDIQQSLTFTSVAHLVRQTTRHLEPSTLKLLDFKPVGIEKQVSDVEELLDIEGSEAAVAVILFGHGGAGKTTLASQVIQQLDLASADFKFCRVIIDDETPDKRSHITKLQRDIIYDLRGDKIELRDPLQGRNEIQETIRSKCCFLFIDNVVDIDYIKQLLPRDLLLEKKESQKLRIVITSRARNLPVLFNDIKCREYSVDSLSEEAAKKLLRETILKDGTKFHQDFDEERLLDDVAVACKGIPLLLSVYGNHLRVIREKHRYEEALESLRKGDLNRFPEEQLEEKLLFVYHKLKDFDAEAPEAFLDICSYFQGSEWEVVSDVVGKSILDSLHKRMLVSRSEIRDQVIVHDILLLMGRNEAKNTRFLNSEESLKALQDKSNLQNVKGISLLDNRSLITLESSDLNAMHSSLRVLQLGNWVIFDGRPCNVEFENLRYLQLGDTNAFPFEDASKLKKLAVFNNQSKPGIDLRQLPGSLKTISHRARQLDAIAKFPEGLKLPALLRRLQLSNFELAPQTLSHLNALEYLSLDKCDIQMVTGDLQEHSKWKKLPEGLKLPASLRNLIMRDCKQVPQTLSHLNALEELTFYKCGMEIMPPGFEQLTKLKTLSLEYCENLTFLPPVSGSMASLTSVSLRGCTRLQELSDDFGMLSALKDLFLTGCSNLTSLPENIDGLSSLQGLDIAKCSRLQRLPQNLGSLFLQTLDLKYLDDLKELPETIGDLSCLKFFNIYNCPSLTSLPDSFVQLQMLDTLRIDTCIKLGGLPKKFGRLTSLKKIYVGKCPRLKELPHGFEALTALKELELVMCRKLVSLPVCFQELACLEELVLESVFCSTLPSDLGKLKKLKRLSIKSCPKLQTFPDGFEKMASLERVDIQCCEMMEGATIDRIVKLQQCYSVDIGGSPRLVERWKEIQQGEEDYPFTVTTSSKQKGKYKDEYEWHRAAKVGLFRGRCIQLDSTRDKLIEHPSMFVGNNTTVAVISFPSNMKHSQHLRILVDRAKERAESASTEQLKVIYLSKVENDGQRTKDTEEEKSILKQLPEGSCVIPSSETRRLLLIQHLLFNVSGKDVCFIADVRLDDQGRQICVNSTRIGENEILGRKLSSTGNPETGNVDDLTRYMDLISFPKGKQEFTWKMFAQALKANNIHQFDSRKGPVNVDELEGKVIALIWYAYEFVKSCQYINLQQIYEDLHGMHVDFEAVWIPFNLFEDASYMSYMRAIQHMPWLSLPQHKFVYKFNEGVVNRVILFDRDGIIFYEDATTAMIAGGANAYPFTDSKIRESLSNMDTKLSLEFLLHGMDFKGLRRIKVTHSINNKLTFLYAEPLNETLKMKSKLEQLIKVYEDIEILYVGSFPNIWKQNDDVKKEYEDTTKEMHWNTLSFWDMVKFWHRCNYISRNKKQQQFNSHMILQEIVKHLMNDSKWLVLLDSDGIVTASGIDVVEYLIHKSNDKNMSKVDVMIDDLIKSLSSGKCPQMAKTFFRDEISNYPHHHQHPLYLTKDSISYIDCDICLERKDLHTKLKRAYSCQTCTWYLCGDCWEVFAKEQI